MANLWKWKYQLVFLSIHPATYSVLVLTLGKICIIGIQNLVKEKSEIKRMGAMIEMENMETINSFLDAHLADKIAIPELENESVCILKPDIDKKHHDAYKKYFTILKFNVFDRFWLESQENNQRYKKLLEAALIGDRIQFLSLTNEMEKKS